MLTIQSTREQAREEIDAFMEAKRKARGTAEPRSTAEMIEAILVIYNRELDALVKVSEMQDLTTEQHDTLKAVTSSTIALHRALTVVLPEEGGTDLSKVPTSELSKAAR